MPAAYCCDCGKPTKDMVICGWSICPNCRNKPVYEFTFLNDQLPSKKGRDFVKRTIRRHLPKTQEAV